MPALVLMLALTSLAARPDVLRVGPGCPYERPEPALAAAHPGDIIEIDAPADGELVLPRVALRIRTPSITIRASGRVVLDGGGFEYSGAGSVPRAIVQVDRAGAGAILEGLVLRSAHNDSGNGAGIRINAADSVTVRRCEIFGCDMGVMSNGAAGEARGQRLELCDIHGNGSDKMKGLSHNLYLGGEDVTLDTCVIRDSTRGHNLKSRARVLHAIGCRIMNSAEREVDLVDSELTGEGGDALLEDCKIVKRRDMAGNRGVIHFGQDGGKARAGTLTLRRCRITTYYISPVVSLSSPGAFCRLEACRVDNPEQINAELVSVAQGEAAGRATGRDNMLSPCYDAASLSRGPNSQDPK